MSTPNGPNDVRVPEPLTITLTPRQVIALGLLNSFAIAIVVWRDYLAAAGTLDLMVEYGLADELSALFGGGPLDWCPESETIDTDRRALEALAAR